jgi:hypothetical protein
LQEANISFILEQGDIFNWDAVVDQHAAAIAAAAATKRRISVNEISPGMKIIDLSIIKRKSLII